MIEAPSEERCIRCSLALTLLVRNNVRFGTLFYFAIMEHTAASVTFENAHNKMSLRIMKVGYALFVIVSVTCYVGNMSAMRQVNAPQTSIRSVSDCAKATGCKMCIHSVTKEYFASKYPSLNYHVSSSSKNLILDLLDGECTVSMSQGLHFDALGPTVNALEICDYYYDNDIYNMYVSQPSSDKYSQALSALSVQVKNGGRYQELYDKYFTSYGALCPSNVDGSTASDAENEDKTFGFKDFLGLYTIMWTFFVIAGAADFLSYHRSKSLKRGEFRERRRSSMAAVEMSDVQVSTKRGAEK